MYTTYVLRLHCRSFLSPTRLETATFQGRATAEMIRAQHHTVRWHRNTDGTILSLVAVKLVQLLQSSAPLRHQHIPSTVEHSQQFSQLAGLNRITKLAASLLGTHVPQRHPWPPGPGQTRMGTRSRSHRVGPLCLCSAQTSTEGGVCSLRSVALFLQVVPTCQQKSICRV